MTVRLPTVFQTFLILEKGAQIVVSPAVRA